MKDIFRIITVLSCCNPWLLFAQEGPDMQQINFDRASERLSRLSTNQLDRMILFGGSMGLAVPVPTEQLKGNYYLMDDFLPFSIILKNEKVLQGKSGNYDLINHQFVYLNDEQIPSAINGNLLAAFVFQDQVKYYHRSLFNMTDKGFVDVAVDGVTLKLLVLTSANILKPSYNLAIDNGERAPVVRKKTTYFFYWRASHTCAEISKNFERKIPDFLLPYKGPILDFAKRNNIRYNDPDSLRMLAEFIESLN